MSNLRRLCCSTFCFPADTVMLNLCRHSTPVFTPILSSPSNLHRRPQIGRSRIQLQPAASPHLLPLSVPRPRSRTAKNPKPMAQSAARRLPSSSAAAKAVATPKLSSIFRNPKRRSPPPNATSFFGDRKPPSPPRGSGHEPGRPRPKARQPWEEEAGALLRRLHEGRYLPGPDLSSAPHATVSPDAVKAAAERFGHDNQAVAKWLSGSDLKKLALFGCPTVERRTVFASKRLRAFFNIQEDKICSSCKLRSSCKFVNQEVPRHNKVILSDTMRIISLFVLDACSKELQVTAELKASICKLLKDTINLSS